MIRVGFVAISQAHQFLHWIPTALELARRDGVTVEVLCASRAGLDFIRRYDPDHLLELVYLPTPSLGRDGLFSSPSRLAVLLLHWRRFQQCDLIVATEASTALLKRFTPFDRPMINLRHGAGDREGGYSPKLAGFDAAIVGGKKDRARMIERRIFRPDRIAVGGYNKFEAIAAPFDPFDDGRPLAIYNPHFDRGLSSWYGHRQDVLAAMAEIRDWNFIVAPHVKLAKGRRLAETSTSNVVIDPGSVHSIDMSYVEAASVYIGDASSQVYEFIRRPRPCIFLNLDHRQWRGNDNFQHWTFGQVIEDIAELAPALARAASLQPQFEPIQRDALAESIEESSVPASVRHADAILALAHTGRFSE